MQSMQLHPMCLHALHAWSPHTVTTLQLNTTYKRDYDEKKGLGRDPPGGEMLIISRHAHCMNTPVHLHMLQVRMTLLCIIMTASSLPGCSAGLPGRGALQTISQVHQARQHFSLSICASAVLMHHLIWPHDAHMQSCS